MIPSIYPLVRPLLFALDPERAHSLALSALRLASSLHLLRRPEDDPAAAVSLMGLRFPNRVGLAAGFDKNGRYVDALAALGFGFIEVGTVTPRPQSGQPRPRLFRLSHDGALINRMGFPNEGAEVVAQRLAHLGFRGVRGVNIGKNASTSLEDAVRDYLECFRIVSPHADYVAINVSSPNTENLRQLQQVDQLQPILETLLGERDRLHAGGQRRVPLLVKISPDLPADEIVGLAQLIRSLRIDGVIATNTSVSRPVSALDGSAMRLRAETGGLSGRPLRSLALRSIATLRSALGAEIPIVAVGGIHSGADANEALQAGADLVQVYTGLIYRGPALVGEIRAALGTSQRQSG